MKLTIHNLSFSRTCRTLLIMVLCAIGFLSLNSCKNDEPYDGLRDGAIVGTWRLDTLASLDNRTVLVKTDKGSFFEGKDLNLTLLDDHNLSSVGYCYDLGGNYVIRENRLLSVTARRLNADQVLPSSQWETMLLYALNHAETYDVSGNRLFIYYETRRWVAKFTRQ